MRRRYLTVLAALAGTACAGGEVVSESSLSADLDTRAGAVRSVAAVASLQKVAVNSAVDWRAGGDAELAADVRVSRMGGDASADPATWQAVGEAATVATVTGESAESWVPTVRHLYRLELVTDGVVRETAYLDLDAASDLEAKTLLSDCTAQAAVATTPCTGHYQTPEVTVTDGQETLVPGRDYVVVYKDNFYAGTANVILYGVGAYGGVAGTSFQITPSETTAVDDSNVTVALDTRVLAVRKLMTVDDLFSIAWNSAADWRAGGDGGATATVAVSPAVAVDPADPTAWTAAGDPAAIKGAAGEGTVVWEPAKRGFYLLTLTAGDRVETAPFDLSETAGLQSGKPVGDFTVVLSAESFVCNGHPAEPSVVVSNGTVTLVKDTDYAISYGNNFYVGTATVTVTGIGEYEGRIEKTYAIVPQVPETQDRAETDVALDTRIGPDGELHLHLSGERLDYVTFNSAAPAWPAGGDAAVTARVRLAPVTSVDEIPADGAYRTIAEGTGEQVKVGWHMGAKMVRVVLELFDGESWGDPVETRVIRYDRASGTLVIVR